MSLNSCFGDFRPHQHCIAMLLARLYLLSILEFIFIATSNTHCAFTISGVIFALYCFRSYKRLSRNNWGICRRTLTTIKKKLMTARFVFTLFSHSLFQPATASCHWLSLLALLSWLCLPSSVILLYYPSLSHFFQSCSCLFRAGVLCNGTLEMASSWVQGQSIVNNGWMPPLNWIHISFSTFWLSSSDDILEILGHINIMWCLLDSC